MRLLRTSRFWAGCSTGLVLLSLIETASVYFDALRVGREADPVAMLLDRGLADLVWFVVAAIVFTAMDRAMARNDRGGQIAARFALIGLALAPLFLTWGAVSYAFTHGEGIAGLRLPGGDGVALARELHALQPRPLVVFTTAYERYAVAAFEVQAIDYLMKPFDDARFQVALRRAEQALVPSTSPRAARYAQRLVIRSIGRVQLVEVAQIDWLEASGNYVEIHAGGQSFLHRERLRVLEDQLDPEVFVRIHRSIIVNRAAIKELRPLAGGDYSVLLASGSTLRLSRTYRAALELLWRDR